MSDAGEETAAWLRLRIRLRAEALRMRRTAKELRQEVANGIAVRQSAESKNARADVLDSCAGTIESVIDETHAESHAEAEYHEAQRVQLCELLGLSRSAPWAVVRGKVGDLCAKDREAGSVS